MPLLRGDRKREDKKNEQFEFGQKMIISLNKKKTEILFCLLCHHNGDPFTG